MPENDSRVEIQKDVGDEKKKSTVKPSKTVPVTVVSETGDIALVQYAERGEQHRCTIPANEIENGKCSKQALSAGVVYGMRWEDYLPTLPKDVALALGNKLRENGIWTAKDLENYKVVTKIIKSVIGNIYSLLCEAAKEVANDGKK